MSERGRADRVPSKMWIAKLRSSLGLVIAERETGQKQNTAPITCDVGDTTTFHRTLCDGPIVPMCSHLAPFNAGRCQRVAQSAKWKYTERQHLEGLIEGTAIRNAAPIPRAKVMFAQYSF